MGLGLGMGIAFHFFRIHPVISDSHLFAFFFSCQYCTILSSAIRWSGHSFGLEEFFCSVRIESIQAMHWHHRHHFHFHLHIHFSPPCRSP